MFHPIPDFLNVKRLICTTPPANMNTTNGNETMDELCAGWTWWCEKLAQKLVDQAHDLNKSEDELAHGFIGGRKSLIGG